MTKPFSSWTYDDAANAVQAKLFNMCPNFSAINLGNNGLVDLVLTCQPRLCAAWPGSQFPLDVLYLLVSQLGNPVVFSARRQPNLKGVFRVAGKGRVLQVLYTVISLYSVKMVNVVSEWFWTNEGSGYKAMHRVSSFLSRKTEYGIPVAVGSFDQFQNAASLSAAALFISSDPTETGNGVDSSEPPNNRPPFFCSKFFGAKFVDRHGMNLLLRFVSSLGWGGVKPSFQPL